MNNPEFSTQFDILFNNIASNQAPGLNEYEKSVFLTKAEKQLLLEYFNSRTDGVGGGFDGSQKRQYDFSSLIKVANPIYYPNPDSKIDRRGLVYIFPQDYYLTVNELLYDTKYQYSVLPISYSEYQTLMLKPYSFPVKKAAWRLFNGEGVSNKFISSDPQITFSCAPNKDFIPYTINIIITDLQYAEVEYSTMPLLYSTSDDNQYSLRGEIDLSTNPIDLYLVIGHDDFIQPTGVSYKEVFNRTRECFKQLKAQYYSNELPEGIDGDNVKAVGESLNWLSDIKAPDIIIDTEGGTLDYIELTGNTVLKKDTNIPSAEIIGKFNGIPNFTLRYIRKPAPIILDDLTDYGTDLSIDGETSVTECELPEETHQEILERAVTLAKLAWQGQTASTAALQQRAQDKE